MRPPRWWCSARGQGTLSVGAACHSNTIALNNITAWRSPVLRKSEMAGTRPVTHVPCPGFTWRKKLYLHPEEACYLVDRGDLMLFVELQGQQRLLSVQEAYELMVGLEGGHRCVRAFCRPGGGCGRLAITRRPPGSAGVERSHPGAVFGVLSAYAQRVPAHEVWTMVPGIRTALDIV